MVSLHLWEELYMKIRPARDTDMNLVLSTWMSSVFSCYEHYAGRIHGTDRKSIRPFPSKGVFFEGHQLKIKALLLSPKTECLVCVAPDDDNQIIGWIVFDPDTVHYCYVKHVFRKYGAAKALMKMPKTAKFYSHHTTHSKYINQGLTFDPYKF